jgi:hypothetical protein
LAWKTGGHNVDGGRVGGGEVADVGGGEAFGEDREGVGLKLGNPCELMVEPHEVEGELEASVTGAQ